MGIPTVKRKVKSYLTETLHSLIDKLSPEEKLDCVMVVFIGEVSPRQAVTIVALFLIARSTSVWDVTAPYVVCKFCVSSLPAV